MNEFAVICPTNPAVGSDPAVRTASWNIRSKKGTDSAYVPEHERNQSDPLLTCGVSVLVSGI